jgi:hypothetical protein
MLKLYRETLKEHDPFWNHEERILFGKSVPHLTKHGVENDEGTLLSWFTARYNHALQMHAAHPRRERRVFRRGRRRRRLRLVRRLISPVYAKDLNCQQFNLESLVA